MANITNHALAEHAAEIRRLGKRAVADVIEIGRRLTDANASPGAEIGCRGWRGNSDGGNDRAAIHAHP